MFEFDFLFIEIVYINVTNFDLVHDVDHISCLLTIDSF